MRHMINKQLCILMIYAFPTFHSTISHAYSIDAVIRAVFYGCCFAVESQIVQDLEKKPPWNEISYLPIGAAILVNNTLACLYARMTYRPEINDPSGDEWFWLNLNEAITQSVYTNLLFLGMDSALRVYEYYRSQNPAGTTQKSSEAICGAKEIALTCKDDEDAYMQICKMPHMDKNNENTPNKTPHGLICFKGNPAF